MQDASRPLNPATNDPNTPETPMLRLGFILHLFIGSTLAGSAVVAALVIGQDTLVPILIAAGLGFLAAFPVTYVVTKKLYRDR